MANLQTERLLLKPYQEKDKESLIDLFTDEKVMKHVGDGVLPKMEAELIWEKLHNQFYKTTPKTIWAVFSKEDNRYIGHASIRPMNTKSNNKEIGFILKRKEWGKGFATEITKRLIQFSFEELNQKKIFATVDNDNYASINVLEKSGMKFLKYGYDEEGSYSIFIIYLKD